MLAGNRLAQIGRVYIVNTQTAFAALLALAACHEPTGRVNDFNSGQGAPTARSEAQGAAESRKAPTIIIGTPGDDVIEGTPGDDVISGGAGNDVICGGPCPDRIPRAPVRK